MVTCCGGGHVDGGMHVTGHQSRTRRANKREASGRTTAIANRKLGAASPPPAAGSCRCDGRILAPAPQTLVCINAKTPAEQGPSRLSRRSSSSLPSPGWTRTVIQRRSFSTLDICAAPPLFSYPVQQRPLADTAALIPFFFFLPLLISRGRYPRRRRSFSFFHLAPAKATLIRQDIPYTTPTPTQQQQHLNIT